MVSFVSMSIGEEIRNARKAQKYSQTELANICGFTQRELSNYESGKVTPSLDRLELIAKALDSKWRLISTVNVNDPEETVQDIQERINEIGREFNELQERFLTRLQKNRDKKNN